MIPAFGGSPWVTSRSNYVAIQNCVAEGFYTPRWNGSCKVLAPTDSIKKRVILCHEDDTQHNEMNFYNAYLIHMTIIYLTCWLLWLPYHTGTFTL